MCSIYRFSSKYIGKNAIEKVNAAGGIVKNYVSRETDYLVITPRQLDMFEEERKSKK